MAYMLGAWTLGSHSVPLGSASLLVPASVAPLHPWEGGGQGEGWCQVSKPDVLGQGTVVTVPTVAGPGVLVPITLGTTQQLWMRAVGPWDG